MPWLWKVMEMKWVPTQEAMMDEGKAGGSLDQQSPERWASTLLATHIPQNTVRGLQSRLLGTPTWVGARGWWAVLVNGRARLLRVSSVRSAHWQEIPSCVSNTRNG